jgi:hypothetical protein
MGRLVNQRLSALALVVFSSVVALLACELATRLIAPQDLSGSVFVEAESGPYSLNRSHGVARHQFGERVVYYSFAAPHLRGPSPREARHRILVLGDSFTFGWLLADADTYVSRMQGMADAAFGRGAYGLLNAAAGGWGTADQLAYYEDFGGQVGASTVLVFLNTDDVGRSLKSSLFRREGDVLVRTAWPVPRRSLKSTLKELPLFQAGLENSHLMQLARRAVLNKGVSAAGPELAIPASMDSDPNVARAFGTLLFTRLSRLTKERGSRLVVVTTGWHRFGTNPNEPTAAFISTAATLFRKLGVPYFDISDRVYERTGGSLTPISIAGDGHPNELGAEIIAEEAWRVLNGQL